MQLQAPALLRFYVLVPLTVVLVIVSGLLFSLPPGPLCDEGMVLFMEGGCDMGDSNVFFFSKLGALVMVSFALVFAAGRKRFPLSTFVPHLMLLCWLGWQFRSGGRCDTYYSHPNGSIGQMALEIAAFAVLGLALLPFIRGRPLVAVVTAALAWNGFHIAAFYAWLRVTNHWTWEHTWLLVATLLAAAIGVALSRSHVFGRRDGEA
jgi:hypothetical protein